MNAARGDIYLYAKGSAVEVFQAILRVDTFDSKLVATIVVGWIGDKLDEQIEPAHITIDLKIGSSKAVLVATD